MREEPFLLLKRKEKGEGNKYLAFRRANAYCMLECCIKCQTEHANSKEKHAKGNRCEKHESFTDARGLRPALYKGLHATAAKLVQKVVAGADHGNRALGVKLAKMLYVPGVAHR